MLVRDRIDWRGKLIEREIISEETPDWKPLIRTIAKEILANENHDDQNRIA